MADSIFNRPLFAGAGQSEKADKAIEYFTGIEDLFVK